jgi:FkbM family methyltransferase
MAIAAWRRIETSPGYLRAKTSLKRLLGREVNLKVEVNVDTLTEGGWCFATEGINRDSIVYSLGVGDDISFDLSIIENFDSEVHAFDPTPSTVSMLANKNLPDRFHFHPWAITARDGTLKFYPRVRKDGRKSETMYTMVAEQASIDEVIEVPTFCLSSVTSKLGHSRIDLLKIDIEGAEYEVLEGLLDSPVKPRQLLVEFHHRFPGIGLEKTVNITNRLKSAGYKIFDVSVTGVEVSFLHMG